MEGSGCQKDRGSFRSGYLKTGSPITDEKNDHVGPSDPFDPK